MQRADPTRGAIDPHVFVRRTSERSSFLSATGLERRTVGTVPRMEVSRGESLSAKILELAKEALADDMAHRRPRWPSPMSGLRRPTQLCWLEVRKVKLEGE